jgi:ATP-dependent DNA helicase RecQ
VVSVLRGENTEMIRKRGHEQLTTYGLLREHPKTEVRDWVYQLISQHLLFQVGEEYPILKLNEASWEVMRGKRRAHLVQPIRRTREESPKSSRAAVVSWEGVDEGLFEELRDLRRRIAQEQAVPTYVIFHDGVLRELARIRPTTKERMRQISGVGDVKLTSFGDPFLQAVSSYCDRTGLSRDVTPPRPTASAPTAAVSSKLSPRQQAAFARFREGTVIEDVMHEFNLSRSTVVDYLALFLRHERPPKITAWVPDDLYHRIAAAARQVGTDRLKPIYVLLGEQAPYDAIRLVLAHLQASSPP